MDYSSRPWALTWQDVDPGRHPFDPDAALGIVGKLAPASAVPARPPGRPGDRRVVDWAYRDGDAWADAMAGALVGRFGPWAAGWRWARDEGDFGGGPIGTWCCARDSVTEPGPTLERVAGALVEWRAWLAELAERFERYPLGDASGDARIELWQRGAVHLIHRVVERTGAGDAWYRHCAQVLTWYLARWGVPQERAAKLVAHAIGGRFGSWTGPEPAVVDEVAGLLAQRAARRPRR